MIDKKIRKSIYNWRWSREAGICCVMIGAYISACIGTTTTFLALAPLCALLGMVGGLLIGGAK